jgi:PIN like domain
LLQQPDDLVLYLNENLCNVKAISDTLAELHVRFERHLDYFRGGAPDDDWIPLVGQKGWVLLTADKRIRYNFLEKRALERNSLREFVFASGNMSGADMALALRYALPKIRRMCRRFKFKPPFVAAITRNGEVHIRWPLPVPKI